MTVTPTTYARLSRCSSIFLFLCEDVSLGLVGFPEVAMIVVFWFWFSAIRLNGFPGFTLSSSSQHLLPFFRFLITHVLLSSSPIHETFTN